MPASERIVAAPRGQSDADTAFRLARRKFFEGERLDMQALAAELGVDRSTLFRWVGNRDALHVRIMYWLADSTLRALSDAERATGPLRIANIAGDYTQSMIDADYFRTFLRRDPQRSLRLTTTKASPLQQHAVATFERLLADERRGGHLQHPMADHDLAYLVVRIIESFVFADLITGEEPDAPKVRAAILALLGFTATSTAD